MKSFLLLIICCFSTQQLLAKKLYQYKDALGQWHYSDKAPRTKQKVEVKQLKVAQKQYVHLKKIKEKWSRKYHLINEYYAPIEVEFYLTKSRNVQTVPILPKRFIVEHGESETLLTVSPKIRDLSWRYSLKYKYTLGSPKAKHNETAVYLPPFSKKSTFRISQGFNGKFSHTGDGNRYAVDISMPLKTPIHASRAGIVVEVKNDFFKNGLTEAHKRRANTVRILHDDGSMAVYVHLSLETVQVYEGLKVAAGQLIGYSGNTGYSTGPHLHFAININKGMKTVSIPFKFTTNRGTQTPIQGKWLRH